MVDYYKLLGVSPGATPAQIRRAFLSRSKSLHPDKVTNGPKDPRWAAATRAFQDLNEAYTILRDGESRSRYDAYRHASASQPSASSTKSTRPTSSTDSTDPTRSKPSYQNPTRRGRPDVPLSGTRFDQKPPEDHWAYPKESGLKGLFLAYFRKLSPSNQGGFLALLVLLVVYFFLQFRTILDWIF